MERCQSNCDSKTTGHVENLLEIMYAIGCTDWLVISEIKGPALYDMLLLSCYTTYWSKLMKTNEKGSCRSLRD